MIAKPPEFSLQRRVLLYAGAWVAAFLCFIISDPKLIVVVIWFLPFFPVGLVAWFNPRSENFVLIAVLWLAYLVHGFFTLTARKRVRFYLLLLGLAIILLFNVIGCYRVDVKFT